MPNYQNSKIYKIIDLTNNNIYIGSTTKKLSRRLGSHTSNYKLYLNGKYKYITSFEIIKNGDYKIELIEAYPCDRKDQLITREGYYIKNRECVNKNIAGRTKIEYLREYYIKNKHAKKQYREKNKDKILAQCKIYREQNRDKNRTRANTKFKCDCGGSYTYANKRRHFTSKKHQKLNY